MALTRRELLRAGTGLAAGAWFTGCRRRPAAQEPLSLFPGAAGGVLLAVLEQLLPGGVAGLPGAGQAGVVRYIDRELMRPAFKDLQRLVQHGIAELSRLALAEHGTPFPDLPARDQQAYLAKAQQGKIVDRGRFFQVLLTLALEGYLGAPRHGGNRDGMVWQAIGFDPARMGADSDAQLR